MSTLTLPAVDRPHLAFRGREIPVVLPSWRDPRLRLSAVIMTLQVLGQTVLDFKLSIAQILVTIGVSAIIEIVVAFRREGMLIWPASAILTGNSVAFILRASGTKHGDWWSLNGIHWFLLAAVLSLLSKYLVRAGPGGRHLFNPSNVGIVWVLLVIGPAHVFPQYLWWGPFDAGLAVTVAVILAGGVWVMRPVRMYGMALSFLLPFAVLVGIFAASGREFVAIWHEGPISGVSYWLNIALSPEVLIFVFFMMSDPQTAPKAPLGRIVYGAGTALVSAGLLYFQPTEFGIKLSILSSLTVVCALVPLIEAAVRRVQQRRAEPPAEPSPEPRPVLRRRVAAALSPAVLAAVIIAVAAPVDTATFAGNEQVINIERGLAGRNAQ